MNNIHTKIVSNNVAHMGTITNWVQQMAFNGQSTKFPNTTSKENDKAIPNN